MNDSGIEKSNTSAEEKEQYLMDAINMASDDIKAFAKMHEIHPSKEWMATLDNLILKRIVEKNNAEGADLGRTLELSGAAFSLGAVERINFLLAKGNLGEDTKTVIDRLLNFKQEN